MFPPRSWLPCLLTASNIAVGFTSMILAAAGRFEAAVYLFVLAFILDMLDGRVARLLRATSEIGRQLDSFSDAVSFGAAPALLVYLAVLHEMGPAGLVPALLYLFAGLFRLSRFNLLSDVHTKARRTMGVPIPIGASYLMAAVLMRDRLPAAAAAVVVLAVAAGMISRGRLPDMKGLGPVTAMLLVGMVNYLVFVAWPNWYTVGWWTVWNLLIVLVARVEDRRLALAPSVET
jgi:CDP-diacylglycerol--serine O-phosphatidyltransferase